MNIASLFNLAGPDLFIILIIVLLLFGAKNLPDLNRGMSQAMREFLKARDEFERELFEREWSESEKRPTAEDRFAAVNRVLMVIVGLAVAIFLCVLLSQH